MNRHIAASWDSQPKRCLLCDWIYEDYLHRSVVEAGDVIRRWRRVVCACAEAVMTSSSNYDIRRNLIDAPSCDSQLPVAGGSDLALGGPGVEGRRMTLRGCSLRGLPHAMSQDSLSIKYRRLAGSEMKFVSVAGVQNPMFLNSPILPVLFMIRCSEPSCSVPHCKNVWWG